eukprot:scaffold4354_cov411-Prasinococcus_capsulatus_cf.AAC.2
MAAASLCAQLRRHGAATPTMQAHHTPDSIITIMASDATCTFLWARDFRGQISLCLVDQRRRFVDAQDQESLGLIQRLGGMRRLHQRQHTSEIRTVCSLARGRQPRANTFEHHKLEGERDGECAREDDIANHMQQREYKVVADRASAQYNSDQSQYALQCAQH